MEVRTRQQVVRPGYKQTEVGIVPREWKEATIGDISSISVGRDLHEDSFSSIRDATYKFPVYSNTVENYGLYGFYSVPEYDGESVTVVGRGVGLGTAFARTGAYGAIGRLIVLFPNNETDSRFLAAYINHKVTIFHESSGIPQLTGIQISKYKIAVPPINEQRTIAVALGDVDNLIDSLEELIIKKCDLKQAAMQQLLTGKRRLPGFSEAWETKRLGDVAHIKTGKRNNEDKIEDGAYPLFVRSQTVERINSYSYDCEAILVPGEGGIGSIFHYINGKFDCHQRVYKISDFNADTCGKFIYYCMIQTFNKQAVRNSVKATVDSLRLPTFLEFEFLAPQFDEQTAIATVLSDMEAEIAALEQRQDKTRALKQGMMQELLTGKIRLV